MGRKAKIKKQRQALRAENQPLNFSDSLKADWKRPELINRRTKFLLTHDLTEKWLQSQWRFLLGKRPFISAHQQSLLASKLLKSLAKEFTNTYEFDIRAELSLEKRGSDYDVAVWFDSVRWTVRTGIANRSTKEILLTDESNEWELKQIPYPFSQPLL